MFLCITENPVIAQKPDQVNKKNAITGNAKLHIACINNDIAEIESLITQGADLDLKNGDEHSPVHIAAVLNHYDALKLLIDHGADVNIQDKLGITALHLAVIIRNKAMVSYLIENNADVNAETKNKLKPIHYCFNIEGLEEEFYQFLVQKAEDAVNYYNYRMDIDMNILPLFKERTIIQLLLDNKTEITIHNNPKLYRYMPYCALAWHAAAYEMAGDIYKDSVQINDSKIYCRKAIEYYNLADTLFKLSDNKTEFAGIDKEPSKIAGLPDIHYSYRVAYKVDALRPGIFYRFYSVKDKKSLQNYFQLKAERNHAKSIECSNLLQHYE